MITESKITTGLINGIQCEGEAETRVEYNAFFGDFTKFEWSAKLKVANSKILRNSRHIVGEVVNFEGVFIINGKTAIGTGEAIITDCNRDNDSKIFSVRIEGLGIPNLEKN